MQLLPKREASLVSSIRIDLEQIPVFRVVSCVNHTPVSCPCDPVFPSSLPLVTCCALSGASAGPTQISLDILSCTAAIAFPSAVTATLSYSLKSFEIFQCSLLDS